ncbi:uncharacterized protein BO97DRAFT_412480 [Aspergillus homomorphus CBS 101889]|uniref:Uncharacterized protein n=1 Tax=Aspergillus homomorphus (strain CBS 101889) TaxID=1450537 RepID=A0A395I3A1_ASPHC|nr:hypothetical protein BO97DRAFT_412480 [Aspergillus homomorphus CBS 101889]RAL14672.1 hypothetical protein BO97DRAFT_412480 [Aspergillus homomorphus CBS 101889]
MLPALQPQLTLIWSFPPRTSFCRRQNALRHRCQVSLQGKISDVVVSEVVRPVPQPPVPALQGPSRKPTRHVQGAVIAFTRGDGGSLSLLPIWAFCMHCLRTAVSEYGEEDSEWLPKSVASAMRPKKFTHVKRAGNQFDPYFTALMALDELAELYRRLQTIFQICETSQSTPWIQESFDSRGYDLGLCRPLVAMYPESESAAFEPSLFNPVIKRRLISDRDARFQGHAPPRVHSGSPYAADIPSPQNNSVHKRRPLDIYERLAAPAVIQFGSASAEFMGPTIGAETPRLQRMILAILQGRFLTGAFGGACANCKWSDKGSLCSEQDELWSGVQEDRGDVVRPRVLAGTAYNNPVFLDVEQVVIEDGIPEGEDGGNPVVLDADEDCEEDKMIFVEMPNKDGPIVLD